MKLLTLLNNLYNGILDITSPIHCIVCEKLIGSNKSRIKHLCLPCFDSIPYATEPEIIFNNFVANFNIDELSISSAYSLMSYQDDSDYMKLIYNLKYFGLSDLGFELGRELGLILDFYKAIDYNYIVPVPIHHARRRERGYNQSEKIALGISDITKIPVNYKSIKRIKYTQSQTKLNKEQRMTNVAKIFASGKDNMSLRGKKILLTDDVLTTGSTLNACGNLLLELGAKRVDVATLLYAK
jgi:ComF family protein